MAILVADLPIGHRRPGSDVTPFARHHEHDRISPFVPQGDLDGVMRAIEASRPNRLSGQRPDGQTDAVRPRLAPERAVAREEQRQADAGCEYGSKTFHLCVQGDLRFGGVYSRTLRQRKWDLADVNGCSRSNS